MYGELKADIVNEAYAKLRISGITRIPGPNENEKALLRLENIMHESYGECLGYNFEDLPDLSSLHNIEPKYRESVSAILAYKLVPDFGKGFKLDPTIASNSNAAHSFLSSATAIVNPIEYPNRMPIGSGNRHYFFLRDRYYRQTIPAPATCDTKQIYNGMVLDETETWSSELTSTESITSYTIDSDSGLTISNDSLSTPEISYRVTAGEVEGLQRVIFTVNVDSGRVLKRVVNYNVTIIQETA